MAKTKTKGAGSNGRSELDLEVFFDPHGLEKKATRLAETIDGIEELRDEAKKMRILNKHDALKDPVVVNNNLVLSSHGKYQGDGRKGVEGSKYLTYEQYDKELNQSIYDLLDDYSPGVVEKARDILL